ncbi:Flp pilus assembly protein CpaB [Bremerella sp. T1]|uniref:Flp pilus assembly protein CpaB n=1 Tax=Bremerella sp. TYQ1 TaxID=3119568 RepID=UPI001CCB5EE6|nr:Flp pilus assembly protein CpaB [Bremerella volcania]UBM36780.1 Flp pilus assembly protein CpaB [Bremerella volcania]
MRPKSLILIIIALGCGLVASIGISQVLEQQSAQPVPQVEMENIFVALEEIDINEPIKPEMIKLEPWPADKIPEGAIRELENVEERRPRSRLFAGEVILEGKLFGSDEDQGASKLIPKGYRVHSVRVTAESSASGLILPGDRVDVLVYLQVTNQNNRSQKKQMTRTILTNCRVFAVNEQIHRDADDDDAIAAKTVSLLVTPKQVEILVLASRLGSLSLSLRPPDESGDDEAGVTDDATIAELLGITENADPNMDNRPKQPAVAQDQKPAGGGFLDFLKNSQASLTSPTMGALPAEQEPEWTMDLLSPDGVRRFEFGADEELPLEVAPGASSSRSSTMRTSLPAQQPSLPPGSVGQPSQPVDTAPANDDLDLKPSDADSDSMPAGSDLDFGQDDA